ncbi:hypothetical protein ACWGCW_07465 [Streptomyces sp. NPDC054933]
MKPSYRRVRLIAVVACVLVTGILWTVRGLAPAYVDLSATSATAVVAIVAIFAPWLSPQRPTNLDELLDQQAVELTATLVEQWKEESEVRGFTRAVLPVRFSVLSGSVPGPAGGAARAHRLRRTGSATSPPCSPTPIRRGAWWCWASSARARARWCCA